LGSCSRFVHTVLGKPTYCLQAKSMCGKYIQAQGTTTERPVGIRAGCGNRRRAFDLRQPTRSVRGSGLRNSRTTLRTGMENAPPVTVRALA